MRAPICLRKSPGSAGAIPIRPTWNSTRTCPRVSDVELFDIYRGEQIGEGRKSMAFKITFEPDDKPLQPEEVDKYIKKILGNLKFKLGAEIR